MAVAALRPVWCPFRGLCWLIDELSGEHRRERETEARRQAMVNRPPLDEAGFLAALSARPDLAAAALAVREAVAENCYLPVKTLHPDDSRTELEALFRAPREAHWFDLGGSWFDVLAGVEWRLRVRLSVELLERPWAAALQGRRLDSLGQVITSSPKRPGWRRRGSKQPLHLLGRAMAVFRGRSIGRRAPQVIFVFAGGGFHLHASNSDLSLFLNTH